MRNFIYVCFLSIVFTSCHTIYQKRLSKAKPNPSKAEMLTDFDLFQEIFENANAGIYKYHDKREVDSVFASNKSKITDKTSLRLFYGLVWNTMDFTSSCHDKLFFNGKYDKLIEKMKIFFPVPLKVVDNRLITNYATSEIPLGSAIISVNGIPADRFLKDVSTYSSTDGNNVTGKHSTIGTDWLPFYVYLAYGEVSTYAIEFEHNNEKKTAQLDAINYKSYRSKHKKRHSKKYESSLSHPKYSYEVIDSLEAARITVRTFALGPRGTKSHIKYAAFLDTTFKDIKAKNIKTLIVDIRDNGGGDDPNDLLLYSYLTQRKFRENTSAFTLFNEVPVQQCYISGKPEELKGELEEEHNILRDGKYYQNDAFNPFWQPNENAFNGKILLLIDSDVASAASLFGALVKSDTNSIVIGEETAGGYYGHTGHIPVYYKLPNSKLVMKFSIVNIEQDVRKLEDHAYPDGIKPDIEVLQSFPDYLNNVDTQMNFTLNYVKEMMSTSIN